MRANKLLRQAREQVGLSEVEVASRAGLSIHEYSDLEQHADEFISAISLAKAKALSKVLGCRLEDFLADEPLKTGSLAPEDPAVSKPRLLQKRRVMLRMSESEVADAIGFDENTIKQAESDDKFLDTLPIQVLAELASTLQLPFGLLIC
jgi:transcriptional regulator with XRE-family HTH domain